MKDISLTTTSPSWEILTISDKGMIKRKYNENNPLECEMVSITPINLQGVNVLYIVGNLQNTCSTKNDQHSNKSSSWIIKYRM